MMHTRTSCQHLHPRNAPFTHYPSLMHTEAEVAAIVKEVDPDGKGVIDFQGESRDRDHAQPSFCLLLQLSANACAVCMCLW